MLDHCNIQGTMITTAAGAFINKLEIMINFLQIYSLILIIEVDIPWPQAFLDFSVWVRVFALDLENLFHINLPYQQQLKFAIIMTLPAICTALYIGLASISKDEWVDRYVTRWPRVKKLAFLKYFLANVVVIIIAFAIDTASFTSVFQHGQVRKLLGANCALQMHTNTPITRWNAFVFAYVRVLI